MSLIDFFTNHTYRMVFAGTTIVGFVAGMLGCFSYLRKQSLISDVISHSSLPGVYLAFLFMIGILQADGRNMLALVIGAVLIGTCAVMMTNTITRVSKIKVDAAMACVLTMFFGAGMILMRLILKGNYKGKGGIQDYLFGNASVITYADLAISTSVGAVALIVMLLFWKQYVVRSFDPVYSATIGVNSTLIDILMFATIAIATVIGVKSVGLVLMVAFVVTPPAAARQWTKRVWTMTLLSGFFGALGSALGAYISISLGKIPTGPLTALVLFAIFVASLLFAPQRSIIVRYLRRRQARKAFLEAINSDNYRIQLLHEESRR